MSKTNRIIKRPISSSSYSYSSSLLSSSSYSFSHSFFQKTLQKRTFLPNFNKLQQNFTFKFRNYTTKTENNLFSLPSSINELIYHQINIKNENKDFIFFAYENERWTFRDISVRFFFYLFILN